MSKNNKNRHSLPAVILAIVVVAAGAFGIIDSNSADGLVSSILAGGNDTVQASDGSASDIVYVSDIPDYSGDPYIAVNNNVPYFKSDDLTTT